MAYNIYYLKSVVEKDIKKLDKKLKSAMQNAIEDKLKVDPVKFGKPLRYSLKNHRRLRIGDYRIVYKILSEKKDVLVIAIKHRKDIYNH